MPAAQCLMEIMQSQSDDDSDGFLRDTLADMSWTDDQAGSICRKLEFSSSDSASHCLASLVLQPTNQPVTMLWQCECLDVDGRRLARTAILPQLVC